MSESKFKGGNALMSAESTPKPEPKKVLTFGQIESVTQPSKLATQLPESVTQPSTSEAVKEPEGLVTQLPNYPVTQHDENQFPSRILRRQKSIRLPNNKLLGYEDYQHANRAVFRDFQDLVEYALDWVTSRPVTQLPNLPVTQPSTLINNSSNNVNELIINDPKAARVFEAYTRLTSRRPTPNDVEAYGEVAHIDESAIFAGLETAKQRALKAGSRFNGLRYARNCIFEAAQVARPTTEGPAQPPDPPTPEEIETYEKATGRKWGE
jgi:hypothetical protein